MPNISINRLNQLEKAEARLKDKEESESLKPFVNQFLESIGVVLAYKPFEQWPDFAQTIFYNVANKYPTPARLYKERNKNYSNR